MELLFKRIALVGRHQTEGMADLLLDLADHLRAHGLQVSLENECLLPMTDTVRQRANAYAVLEKTALISKVDLVVVVGGDGTLLSIAREIAPYGLPIIGVNQGRLGFMTDIPREEMHSAILAILQGACQPEERILLEGEVSRNGQILCQSTALNEVLFSRGAMGSLIDFELFIDGKFVYSQRSDGLIVSTPTGSTAYALASGGPILHPTIRAIALVPICPQSLSNRPIVVNDTSVVEFVLLKAQDCRVHYDGHTHFDLQPHDRVTIRRYHSRVKLLHPLNYNYYHTLRHKLHWGQPSGMPIEQHVRQK